MRLAIGARKSILRFVPVIAEDEDRRLADEIERARLEEEARILAFQQQQLAQAQPPPITFTNPAGPIEVGVPAGVALPEMPRQMIGDEQYMNELARAQRGSGFINALVDPGGNVTVPGYDPSRDFAALKAQQEATNLQRNQYVNSLVQGGATYAEAFRAGQGRYPQTGNEAMRMRVEQLAQKTQPRALMQPEVVTVDGVKVMRTGPNSFARVPEPRTATAKLAVPPEVAASQKIISGKITDARSELQRAQKRVEEDRGDVNAVNAALRAREKLRGLEQSLIAGSTNWIGAAQAPQTTAPVAAPTQAETVVVTKDGRRYSLPKSQLEEAIKAGYQQQR